MITSTPATACDDAAVGNDESPLADTEVHYLRSEHVGDELKIFVGHCARNGPGASVLYLTDANGHFGAAVDIIRSLQLARHLPPILVVGIGYRTGSLGETVVRRTRDLSPTDDTAFAELYPEQHEMGGAPRLLAFVTDELMPFVEDHFGSREGAPAFFGHSLGGLFGMHVLFHAPTTFARYVLSSPSLWWGDHAIFRDEERYASEHDDLAADVFIGVGADESREGRAREAVNLPPDEREKATLWDFDLRDDAVRMAEQLRSRGYPHLDLHYDVFAEEFHVSVPFLSLSRGLRKVFDAPR